MESVALEGNIFDCGCFFMFSHINQEGLSNPMSDIAQASSKKSHSKLALQINMSPLDSHLCGIEMISMRNIINSIANHRINFKKLELIIKRNGLSKLCMIIEIDSHSI